MGLEVGAIYGSAGLRVDDDGFRELDRRLDAAERRARDDIVQHARLDYDQRGHDRYTRNLDKLDRHHDESGKRAGRFYGSVGTAGARLAAVGTGVGAAAVGVGFLGKTFLTTSNDINESLTKNQQLFGKHAQGIDAWSKSTAKNIGISRKEALAAAGDYGSLFETIGLADKPAANMSMRLSELAGDLASFNNASPAETLEAIKSGLIGEAEPMRRFGALLSEARVQEEAYKTGIAERGAELTEQQKVQARYSLILKDTNAAHGDFERTSGGLANQLRILKAQFTDAGGVLGAKLLPPVTDAVRFLNSLFGSTDKAGKGAESFGDRVRSIGGPIGKTFDTIEREWGKLARGVARAFAGVGDDFDRLKRAGADIAEFLAAVFRRSLPGIRKVLVGLAEVVRGAIEVIAGILTLDFGKAWDGVQRIFGGAFKVILGTIRSFTAPFREAFARIGRAMSGPLGAALDWIEQAFKDFLDFFLGGVSTLIDVVEELANVAGILPGVGDKFDGLGRNLEDARKAIDRYRESLRKTDEEHKDDSGIRRRRQRVRELRDELGELRKGSEAYREKARQLERAEDRLSGAQRDRRGAARVAGRAITSLKGNVFELGLTESDVFEYTQQGVNKLLAEFGAKRIDMSVKRFRSGQRGPGFSTNATGGMYQFGMPGEAGPDSMFGSIGGFNVAVAPGEVAAVFTRHQQEALNDLLGPLGGLAGFVDTVNKPHAAFQAGGIVPIPGMPGESIHQSILGDVVRMIRRYRMIVTDGYAPTGHAAGGEHPLGLAIDTVPGPGGSWGLIDRAMRDSGYPNPPNPPFRWLGWNNEAGHGVGDHAHWSWARGQAGFNGVGIDPDPPRLRVSGGTRAMNRIGQSSADRLYKPADRFLDRRAAAMLPLGGPMTAGGSWGKGRLAALWTRAGGNPAIQNLMAAIALAESNGDPNAHNPSGASGLWQILGQIVPGNIFNPMVNARNAVAKYRSQGLGAWEAYTNGAYGRFLRRGGLIRAQTGTLVGTITAPSLSTNPGPTGTLVGGGSFLRKGGRLSARGRQALGTWAGRVNTIEGRIDDLDNDYTLAARRFDLTDEEFINEGTEETGPTFNTAAIRRRIDEVRKLIRIRAKQVEAYARMLAYIGKAEALYKRLEKTLERLIRQVRERLRGITGNSRRDRHTRAALQRRLGRYEDRLENTQENLAATQEKKGDAEFERRSTVLDIKELENELAPLSNTLAGAPGGLELPEWSAPDTVGDTGDTGVGGGAGGDADAEAGARLEAAERRAQAAEGALLAARQGFAQLFGPGDIGAGGATALSTVSSPYIGAAGAGSALSINEQGQLVDTSGSVVVIVNSSSLIPGGPDEYRKIGEAVVTGMSYMPVRPETIEKQG